MIDLFFHLHFNEIYMLQAGFEPETLQLTDTLIRRRTAVHGIAMRELFVKVYLMGLLCATASKAQHPRPSGPREPPESTLERVLCM